MKLTLKSPAKINLGLKILHKRDDGFHELETILQMVGLYDEIDIEPLPERLEFHCDTPEIPMDESNLVVRAAQSLRATMDKPAGARIRLKKKIPTGAGLGGGSGNAAMTLWGLNYLWDLKKSRQELVGLAAQLGSDVPFFLVSPCALGRGKGDQVTPLQIIKKFNVILVFPRLPIATSWVYQNLNLKLTKKENNISILQNFLSRSEISHLGASLQNDLEPIVFNRYPEIKTIRNRLRASGAKGALLSGSGSTVFAIYENKNEAEQVFKGLSLEQSAVFCVETVKDFSEFVPKEIISYP